MKTIVGLYDDLNDARQAVSELVDMGIDRDHISLVASDEHGQYGSALNRDDETASDLSVDDTSGDSVAGGAATGAVVGGLGGLLLGLGALAIPGIGPVIAAGPIVSAVVGAGVGAAVGGLVGALVEAGVPEEQAGYYAEGVRRGGTLLTAESPDERVEEVVSVMERHDPINVDERASTWRQEGWTRFNGGENQENWSGTIAATANTRSTATQSNLQKAAIDDQDYETDDEDEDKFEVVEEELNVGKRQVDRGGVRIHTRVEEKPVEEQVRLREERVNVQRRPVDRPASETDLQSFKEGTFDVKATSEEPVVEKRARVVEEVVVDKDVQERTQTVRDTVRRKDVDVEQVDGVKGNSGYNRYNTSFRNHWQNNYANSGATWDQYEPAYRYGYTLANDQRYQGRDWNAIEADARRNWSQHYQDSPWEKFKDAVRQGWQQVKQPVKS